MLPLFTFFIADLNMLSAETSFTTSTFTFPSLKVCQRQGSYLANFFPSCLSFCFQNNSHPSPPHLPTTHHLLMSTCKYTPLSFYRFYEQYYKQFRVLYKLYLQGLQSIKSFIARTNFSKGLLYLQEYYLFLWTTPFCILSTLKSSF
jgi:hypothetical protein